ncbi:DinB family protein [Roseivirga pacifica]|uniref:DinB family protein n=1 Tax=Roseivirga pacifica TaxID=1267423 RepID=UPI00227B9799|nr:DinB family protein [Roseivirga pacifica]
MRTDYKLKEITLAAFEEFLMVTEGQVNHKPTPEKWSAKEVLGHLIDSACNNHGRFVRAQFTEQLEIESYAQNEWVEIQDYQNQDWQDLLIMWRQYNLLLSNLMFNTPPAARSKANSISGFQAYSKNLQETPDTLGYLMEDYVAHLKHHLGQIRTLISAEE